MTIIQQIDIKSAQEQVWQAWLVEEQIVKWFSPAAKIEPKVGGKFELYFDPSNKESMSTKGCHILHLEPYNSFTFQWNGPDPFAETMNQAGQLTEIKVTLELIAAGTAVTIHHYGWNNSDCTETLAAIEWHKEAWANMLARLKNLSRIV